MVSKTTQGNRRGPKDAALLLCLSQYRKSQTEAYLCPGAPGRTVSGEQTNDAPVRYLCEAAGEDGYRVRTIFCITTLQAYRESQSSDASVISAYQRFRDTIAPSLEPEAPDSVQVIPIYYDFWPGDTGQDAGASGDPADNASRVYEQLSRYLADLPGDVPIYVDYTGGMRDMSFLMVTLLKFLEFYGHEVKRVVYSYHAPRVQNPPQNRIYEIGYIYDIFQMINGVNDFLTTGSAKLLKQVFEKRFKQDPGQDQDSAGAPEKVIQALIDFSDQMSICDLSGIDAAIGKISSALETYDDSGHDLFQHMFSSLIPEIRTRMPFVAAQNTGIDYPALIGWCLDNSLIQQASILYVEKMPILYERAGLIPKEVVPDNPTIMGGSTREAAKFYTWLPEYILDSSVSSGWDYVWHWSCEISARVSGYIQDNGFNRDALIRILQDCRREAEQEGTDASGRVSRMITRLIKSLWNDFNAMGNRKPVAQDRIEQRTFASYIHTLNNRKDIAAQLAGYKKDSPEYAVITAKKDASAKDSLEKKKKALQVLHDRIGKIPVFVSVSNEDLFWLFAYYFGCKLLRNMMAHASEEVDSNTDAAAEFLRKITEGKIRMTEKPADIIGMLREGIDLSRRVTDGRLSAE